MTEVKGRLGTAWILSPGETHEAGKACFTPEEFAWAKKIASAHTHDPETHQNFWETLFEKKKDPHYDFFDAFPRDVVKEQVKVFPSGKTGADWAKEIIGGLKGKGPGLPEPNS